MPQLRLHFNLDQSTSVADFSMTKGGIPIGLLEVTRFTDPKREQLWKEIHKDWLIDRKHCKSDWRIHLGEGARVKQVRASADEYLREIEKAGIDEFSSSTDARHEEVRRIWEDLDIEYGKVVKWKRPGIGMGGPSSGGFARPETVWNSVKTEVWKDDNRKKLSVCRFSHRYLFVVIEGF